MRCRGRGGSARGHRSGTALKIFIVGSGAREHALTWALLRDDPDTEVVVAPGNPGIAELARCVPVAVSDIDALVALAESERPDFTLIGPEAPLALGIVDRFRERGLPVFGPTRAAAEIETSKAFAKQLMLDAGVATARAERHTQPSNAKRAARAFGPPVVIKASGLAAGKGVIVAATEGDADAAIDAMLTARVFGAAGSEILVEEFMDGEEVSVFGITDGERIVPLVPSQDHKRLSDGDRGPNTGGMGAYAPATAGIGEIVDHIMAPALAALRERGRPFTGLLYAGVMLTRDGPKVVEFNCRFGDPETEAILPLMGRGLRDLLYTVAVGDRLPAGRLPDVAPLARERAYSVATVVASAGYPDRPRVGDVIALPDIPRGVHLFHGATGRSPTGDLVTAGGRVFAVTAVGASLAAAQRESTSVAARIEFAGKHYRTDIGWREIARSGAPRGEGPTHAGAA
jgi:phosphoribosylamine---glycine ligase